MWLPPHRIVVIDPTILLVAHSFLWYVTFNLFWLHSLGEFLVSWLVFQTLLVADGVAFGIRTLSSFIEAVLRASLHELSSLRVLLLNLFCVVVHISTLFSSSTLLSESWSCVFWLKYLRPRSILFSFVMVVLFPGLWSCLQRASSFGFLYSLDCHCSTCSSRRHCEWRSNISRIVISGVFFLFDR